MLGKPNVARIRSAWFCVLRVSVFLALSCGFLAEVPAADRTWAKASGTGDWFDGANGSGGNYPQPGESVDITNGFVLLTNDTAIRSSLSITNATLVFSNWTTRLRATTVNIYSSGVLTLPGAFTEAQMSNRVWVVCTDMELKQGGMIDVSQRGYAANNGLGKGAKHGSRQWYLSGGGGYGGWGGRGVHSMGYARININRGKESHGLSRCASGIGY